MKFSIIVPVYNTEEYLERCIKSVLDQTYQKFELIIINDGSSDNSFEIIKKYDNNTKIKIINQTNHGLSYSRNIGIKNTTGDYIIFLDSDDYLEKELLKTLSKKILNEDMIKFSYLDLKNKVKTKNKNIEFKTLNGEQAFQKLTNSKIIFEMACIYAYKSSYIKKYTFEEGKYHEDFGLVPIMIFHAKSVSSINYYGYVYNRDNDNSITSFTDEKKEYKKAQDTMYFFKKIKKTETDKYLLSFYANSVLLKISKLNGKLKKEYIHEIKKEKVINYILTDTIKRKLKKILIKIKFCLF